MKNKTKEIKSTFKFIDQINSLSFKKSFETLCKNFK